MKQGTDLQDMIEALRAGRRYRNIRHDKLAHILDHAELNVPASWLEESSDPSVLLKAQRGLSPRRRAVSARIPRRAWRALIPAGAAAVLLLLFMTGRLDFMHNNDTGIAGKL